MKFIKKRFDNRCVSWSDNALYNAYFLRNQQIMHSEVFKARGWVFLRDIYESIGLPITKESCILGWHKNCGSKGVLFGFSPIEGKSDYDLEFLCYPILEYLDKED